MKQNTKYLNYKHDNFVYVVDRNTYGAVWESLMT